MAIIECTWNHYMKQCLCSKFQYGDRVNYRCFNLSNNQETNLMSDPSRDA